MFYQRLFLWTLADLVKSMVRIKTNEKCDYKSPKKDLFRKLKVMRWGIQRILYYKQIEHP